MAPADRFRPPRRRLAQALIWFALVMPVFVSIAGLAIDGGVLLMSRRELQSAADGAARAGATRLDMQRLRDSAGTDVQLDQPLAATTAQAYLNEVFATSRLTLQQPPRAQVDVGARRVHVLVHASVQTAFLRIVHIDTAPLEADAYADVQFGIRDSGGG